MTHTHGHRDGLEPRLPAIALAFLLGVCLLHLQPDIRLPLWTEASLLTALPLLLWLFYLKPSQRVLLAFFAGYLWALFSAHSYLQQRLDSQWQGEDLLITGQVDGLVDQGRRSVRFNFNVENVQYQGEPLAGFKPQRLRLSWYHTEQSVLPGQRWQLQLRLKPPHGMLNPGGFDYEKWLFQQGIHATGYVRKSEYNRQLNGTAWCIDGLRQRLIQQISAASDSPHLALLQALSVGYKSNMTAQHWQVMINTGTSHLMAISGLHIGLVAGMVFFIARWLVPVGVLHLISKQQFAASVSLLAAGFYAALAGFAVPTQRAFVMLLVVLMALLLKRPAFSLNTLSLALLVVLLLDPLAPLSAGFWLSFIAVLLIAVIIGGRSARQRGWLQGIRLQWLIALSMLPVSVLLFQQGSLISPLANMLMIPLVGLLIVPMLLIASLLAPLSGSGSAWLFNIAGQILDVVWPLLEWLAQSPLASWQQASLPLPHSLLGLMGGLLLILPRGFPLKTAGLILLLPMIFYQPPRPQPGEFWLQLLDVGQGLSVLVQTRDHDLLYDAGAKRGERFDLGRLVIEPYLRHRGIVSLDRLIISHADNDHAGGADYLLQNMTVQQLQYGGRAEDYAYKLPPFAQNCKAGQRWQWNQVRFEILHPDRDYRKTNQQSCVLKITSKEYSALLTGDIDQPVESRLLGDYTGQLRTDVLLVPHHGSKSSSSLSWLQQLEPQLALVSAGYLNRFRHPADEVMQRYHQLGIPVLNTAEEGAISLYFSKPGDDSRDRLSVSSHRQRKDAAHYWNHRL